VSHTMISITRMEYIWVVQAGVLRQQQNVLTTDRRDAHGSVGAIRNSREEDERMSEITIHYTCKLCGTTRKRLDVPERALDGDPVEWAKDATRRARQEGR